MNRFFVTYALAIAVLLIHSEALLGNSPSSRENEFLNGEKGPVTEGGQFSISTDTKSFHQKEAIPLDLVLENVSKKPIRFFCQLPHSILSLDYRFDIKLPDGRVASLSKEAQHQALKYHYQMVRTKTLDPMQSEQIATEALNKLFDMTQPGKYVITVYRRLSYTEDNNAVEAPSNTVTIIVLEDEKPRK